MKKYVWCVIFLFGFWPEAFAAPRSGEMKFSWRMIEKKNKFCLFSFVTGNLPRGQKFRIVLDHYGDRKITRECIVGQDGKLLYMENGTPLVVDQIPWKITGFIPGELLVAYLITSDSTVKGRIVIIPEPLEVQASDSAHLSVVMVDRAAKSFTLIFSGFKPGESLQLDSRSCDEEISKVISMDSGGACQVKYLPAVADEDGGQVQLVIRREGETLALTFPWGRDARVTREVRVE